MIERQLYEELKKIKNRPVAIGKFTIPSLLAMIGSGYAEFTMKDRIKITESGKEKYKMEVHRERLEKTRTEKGSSFTV